MALNLMRIFKEGRDVSFKGSPTVSPITAALCSSVPLPLIKLSINKQTSVPILYKSA